MSELKWDQTGEKFYETGVDHAVLYLPDAGGNYTKGYAWNGITSVTESPSGAESNKQYADNIAYLNLKSAEEFGATIEAFTYPDEFAECDGTAVVNGVRIGQQDRKSFGFSYRSLLGNDLENTAYGYKLHLVYGCDAAPSEKAYGTVNDSPEAITFSWELTTNPVGIGVVGGKEYKPTAILTIPSDEVDSEALQTLETILYGSAGVDPRLPMPAEVLGLFVGTLTEVAPAAPTFDSGTNTITIPGTAGVVYKINGEVVSAGDVVITVDTVVTAEPASGYKFPAVTDDDWLFEVS